MSPDPARVTVTVGERELQLSNLEKPLFPTGFTKGDMLDYYARIAPAMLPHLLDRPVTVKRFPNGIDHQGFIEKNVPKHAPDWIRTLTVDRKGVDRWGRKSEEGNGRETTEFVVVDELATLMWLVNLAAVEFHTPMWRAEESNEPGVPDLLVFDLDPGPPATISECCQVALQLRQRAGRDHIDLVAKTSGSKGLQLYAPIADKQWPADGTGTFAHELARTLEKEDPGLVVSRMAKDLRRGRVLIDWSQNNSSKTTVSPYSLRAIDGPSVSTPVSWDEVSAGAGGDGDRLLRFTPSDVLARVADMGDLFRVLNP
ncbi:MAG TPA: non-homologous end-joining DNA ligase [Acidimicrobiales bacterium]|nr:non-homologous end-joining DNA ligase [Acidimicrobiales bacterium]